MVRIEVCTGCIEDSLTAYYAGASRIELNSSLETGGLSPSPGVLTQLLENVEIPVVAMVRPRSGDFVYTSREKTAILDDMETFLERGASGLVFGALTREHGLDSRFISLVRREFQGAELVFSRAFDLLQGSLPDQASTLADLGVERILTSGGMRTALEGADAIRSLMGKGIEILPGSGVSSSNALEIAERTGCRWLHGSFTEKGSSAGEDGFIVPPGCPGTSPNEIRRVLTVLEGLE